MIKVHSSAGRSGAAAVGLAAILGLLAGSPGYAASSEQEELAAIRAATDRYQNVKTALADGYIPDPSGACITAEMEGMPAELGAMGIHYLRPDLLGLTGDTPRVTGTGTHVDFHKPAVLLYEPQADGGLVLVGVENLVFEKAWHEAGNSAPPAFLGHTFDRMVDDPATPADEAHGFDPHYDLHVWIHRENPSGTFTPFNVSVTCEHHKPSSASHH